MCQPRSVLEELRQLSSVLNRRRKEMDSGRRQWTLVHRCSLKSQSQYIPPVLLYEGFTTEGVTPDLEEIGPGKDSQFGLAVSAPRWKP